MIKRDDIKMVDDAITRPLHVTCDDLDKVTKPSIGEIWKVLCQRLAKSSGRIPKIYHALSDD